MANLVGEDTNYGHEHDPAVSDGYLLPKLISILGRRAPSERTAFDLGAGTGGAAGGLGALNYTIVGVEPSPEGVAIANQRFPAARIEVGSGYDDLAARYGRFPVVYSLEVIEHVYSPRQFVKTAHDLLEPGGLLVLSTPYHGYWKNLAMALTGKLDRHFTALWDHGHIKFWSLKTLTSLLDEAGFTDIQFEFTGRPMPFAKSMFAIARKPGDVLPRP
ncbi:MAG: class I SAM-dependent methyltransferase [Alphaproteobacteria bacterium]|nr:class I SAM-dependent methyltransferase [Alphaproteobacteria bacterium]MBU2380274.1 class I SAM-dependent methyltransferase [Alphaproteobacteria bacterium]